MWGSDLMKREQEIKETLKLYYDLLTTKSRKPFTALFSTYKNLFSIG